MRHIAPLVSNFGGQRIVNVRAPRGRLAGTPRAVLVATVSVVSKCAFRFRSGAAVAQEAGDATGAIHDEKGAALRCYKEQGKVHEMQ